MLSDYFNRFLTKINEHALQIGNPYRAFGIFAVITYPLYYFIWKYADSGGYENLYLRIIAVVLCIPLIFINHWPEKLKKYIALYWYFTLLYCLPFLFTFFLLKNNFSYVWVLNTMTVIVLSVLLLDSVALIIILFLGVLAGWLAFTITSTPIKSFPYDTFTVIITYFSAILFGIIFSHRKKVIQTEKLRTINTVAESIAHELRTPLRTILSGAEGLEIFFPKLIETYAIAKNENLSIPKIDESHYRSLNIILDNIKSEVNSAFTFINMLLVNANESAMKSNYQACSILECVNQALSRYPFDLKENELIVLENREDFTFLGSQQLMIHVIFNLLKNSLYYIKAANKGKIFIRIENGQHTNKLYFKDTGTGIPKEILSHIFDRFFSRTYHGTGIGLAFCKMVMKSFGGDIAAKSQEGEHAEFIMNFPPYTEKGEKDKLIEGRDL